MATLIFDQTNPNNFECTFIFHESELTLKYQALSSICSTDILDLKILQSDWPRAFWSISQEQGSSQIWDLFKNTANNITFCYRVTSANIYD